VLNAREERRAKVAHKKAVDDRGAAGKGVKFLHEIADNVCEDVTLNRC
jgi:hypothetical protein